MDETMSDLRHPRSRERFALEMDQGNKVDRDQVGDTNINSILARYEATGQPPRVRSEQPLYGDFTSGEDLFTTLNRVNEIRDNFAALPSDVRAAADNDPVTFLDMCQEPEGRQILAGLGIEFEDELEEPSPPSLRNTGTEPPEGAPPPARADSDEQKPPSE